MLYGILAGIASINSIAAFQKKGNMASGTAAKIQRESMAWMPSCFCPVGGAIICTGFLSSTLFLIPGDYIAGLWRQLCILLRRA